MKGEIATIKLLSSDPVPGAGGPHWAWFQQIVATVARPGTTVDMINLKEGYSDPTTPYTEAYNAIEMIKRAYGAEKKGYDAFVIGCCFDPGLRQARALVDIPVIGPTESVALLASTLGNKFSIITYAPCFNAPMEELIERYGLADKLASVRCIPRLTGAEAFGMMLGGKKKNLLN